MNDYEEWSAARRYRCLTCGGEGHPDAKPDWCACGDTREDFGTHIRVYNHGKFKDVTPERETTLRAREGRIFRKS